jgi:excinuclease ABC subunit A
MRGSIVITGACQHNLKNLDCDIPLNSITVITGVSGSGKSSLAFDTIHAEGQRRYIESFSTYARQFMDRMDKPLVGSIEGILPSIAIDQTNAIKTSRSTLGTLTEINDYMKLLFQKQATLYCGRCGKPVRQESVDSVTRTLLDECTTQTCVISFPVRLASFAGIPAEEIERDLRRQGFFRIYQQGRVQEISREAFSAAEEASLNVVVDRVVIAAEQKKRLSDSLDTAFLFGRGLVTLFFPGDGRQPLHCSTALYCPSCNIAYKRPAANLFSFNSVLGACEQCKGFGRIIGVNLAAVIPDPARALQDDAIKPWATPAYREAYHDLLAYCRKKRIPPDKPFEDLLPRQRDAVINGDAEFYGIKGFFDWLESKTYKMHIRVLLSKYRSYEICPACQGTRFKAEALQYRIENKTIADIYALSISQAAAFFRQLCGQQTADRSIALLQQEIGSRIAYLEKVGLGYLTLDRQSRTLSGGEVERASLTTALGSSLVNTLYVLDEPSIGLHPRDTRRLLEIIEGLKNMGNTIVIVEHDPEIIMHGDQVIDLGPSSGDRGGTIVFSGPVRNLLKAKASLTGQYLAGEQTIPLPRARRTGAPGCQVKIRNAALHNLQNIQLSVPLGALVCITGVSGSGKSTLLEEVIFKELALKAHRSTMCAIEGTNGPEHVLLMDQTLIGRTPRSNPLTYMKVFDAVRSLFAQTELARVRGYRPATFSFNSSGGRCEQCQGDGYEKIEMQFLADVYVQCSACRGTRYSPDVLDVTYRGKNIHDILQMTAAEALLFFADTPRISHALRLLEMVGLGYLRLGQPATALSGGESQRLKIAACMRQGSSARTLFLFDEPTTGLHFDDIRRLLQSFDYLISQGHSIIVVEHNLEVIKCADHIIDLGPEGGDAGGRVLCSGPPDDIIRHQSSHTGVFLKQYLARQHDGTAAPPARAENHKPADHVSTDIVIEGACEHNLKNISLRIPKEKVVVITGLSGSGKSTLAFDILFAEGQRRFLETLSPYARQYVHQLQRPDVQAVRGLPPTVAIEQLLSRGGRKSTIATVTEIYHYLRLLFAKVGQQHCPSCGQEVTTQAPPDIAADILRRYANDHILLLAPQVKGRKGYHRDVIQRAKREGYRKVRIDGQVIGLESIFAVRRYHEHQMELVTAEFVPSTVKLPQVQAEVNKTLALGKGALVVLGADSAEKFYSTHSCCPACNLSLDEPDPRLFSFNSRHGACPRCTGLGTVRSMAPESLIADRHQSIRQGALAVLASELLPASTKARILAHLGRRLRIPLDRPLTALSARQYAALFYGTASIPGLAALLTEPALLKKPGWSAYLDQLQTDVPCPDCGGTRLNAAARSVTVHGRSIADLTRMTARQLAAFLASSPCAEEAPAIVGPILQALLPKLELLSKAGLDYLTLDRSADTLSGGEAQRVRLAAQAASTLRGVAYVLDEPTIGLHPHDGRNLLNIICDLQQHGNSVIIVEHDEEIIRNADFIIDLGIGGGTHGGAVVAAGTVADIMGSRSSITGAYLARDARGAMSGPHRPIQDVAWTIVSGASQHNLKEITAQFPVGRLSVVTGISGSGKTTLVLDTLYQGVRKALGLHHGPVGAHGAITGGDHFKRVVEINQSPIGKTHRSVPPTYVGFYDAVRQLFALVPDARVRGFTARRFSFNLTGGRCEACAGHGKIRVSMSFLPDMYVDCEDCRGTRFNDETLQILYKGKNIAEVLAMTIEESGQFFKDVPPIARPLQILDALGLGYLTLGQPSPTLSGGEAQRIKIAAELGMHAHGTTLYILDEPTTGLHAADIEKLMHILHALVDQGNTVVIIEHNLEVICQADYLIDLGPGGGAEGGSIVANGTPEQVASCRNTPSYTAAYLRQYLERRTGIASHLRSDTIC